MSELKGHCPNCNNEVEFVTKGSFLYCPVCWHTFKQAGMGAKTENRKERPGLLDDLLAALRVLGIFLLVLAGIFLVFLAFLYAACSNMNL